MAVTLLSMRRLLAGFAFVAVTTCAATARAATVDQIIALAQAGVSDEVILALIDRDHTVLSLDTEQLVALKRAGVSEPVVIAMLRSGRGQSPEEEAALAAAPPYVAPDVLIIGHEPDVPNWPSFVSAPAIIAPQWFLPYAFNGPPALADCVAAPAVALNNMLPSPPPAIGRMTSSPFLPAMGVRSVEGTVGCTPVVPRSRIRRRR